MNDTTDTTGASPVRETGPRSRSTRPMNDTIDTTGAPSPASDLDPITLAVIGNGLQQVCNEMDLTFVRAAFSPVISEALDRSDGIYHRDTGALIAQGELGLPVFVGTMQFGTRAVIERARDLAPGDLYIVNDPYLGGTHLMDVRFVKPFFYRGELFAWLANTGHWPDTGGMVPGGFSANATEVEQEGLRLPPVKLFKRGEMDEEILSIILSNIRIADQRIGDVEAQAAALAAGERRLTALLDRYGRDTVEAGIEELEARAERQMRARIATIPDGRYHGRAWVDSDGVVDEPLTVDMRIEKRGTDIFFDMSGSSPPCAGPMNSVIATTRSSIYLAMKHVFPEVPINADVRERIDGWKAEAVLATDAAPALYVLRQTFTAPDGSEHARLGFYGALRVEDYDARVVLPHERTLAGPKADRLKLLRATRTNLSSVFMLYEDPDRKLEDVLASALAGDDVVRATDTAGVRGELARLTDPAAIAEITNFLAPRPVVIADGHHRYETALAYRDERRAAGDADTAGSERILAYFSNAYAEGTLLLPIHRLVRHAAPPTDEAWARLESQGWTLKRVPAVAVDDVPALIEAELGPLADRVSFAADDGSGTVRVFSRAAGDALSVRVIHGDVLAGVFGIDDDALREGAVAFPKSAIQTARDLAAGEGTVALYLNPLRPEDVFRVTGQGETLPQKSTYFAPKLATGMLFRELDADDA